MKFWWQFKHFHSRKCIWKCLQKKKSSRPQCVKTWVLNRHMTETWIMKGESSRWHHHKPIQMHFMEWKCSRFHFTVDSRYLTPVNTLRPRQNGRHFADDVFKCIFLNGNLWIVIKISLKFVPKGPINNIPALVQIMAWRRTGHKPLSEQMMA